MDPNRKHSADPKHVWLVNLFFGPGLAPTGVLLESLAVDLEQRHWHVTVLTGAAEYRKQQVTETSGFSGTVYRFRCQSQKSGLSGKLRTWIWFYVKVAWYTLWHTPPDVVVVQTTPPFLHTIFAIRRLLSWRRPKLILWNQDTYPESLVATNTLKEGTAVYRLLEWIARWSGRRVDGAVALDGAMAMRLQKHEIRQIRVVPNWDVVRTSSPSYETELSHVKPSGDESATHESGKKSWRSLPAELLALAKGFRFKIVYTGNLGVGHDLAPLWDYLARNPNQTEFLFLFVGEGDRTRDLQDKVARSNWECVKFWPYLPTMEFHALLEWSDYGLVALEPSCLGLMSPSKMHAWLGASKPIVYVGPDGSNVTETIHAYDCGFIIDPSDLRGVDRFAERVLDPSFDCQVMQHQAKKAWSERHTSDVGLRAWQDVFASLPS